MTSKRKETSTKKTKKSKLSTKLPTSKKREKTSSELTRPPVVTLMGHVDHGKTTLLDAIRKSKQVEKEHGGITQHIGAYQVEFQGRKITFIDTPGHAAFAKMRAHGARVTDIVVLVVAANDGVKPQTREALAHIRATKTPFLVAINKIDLPEADVDRVKAQLAEEDVVVESYGGDIVAVEVSAKTKKNLDQLLEMILLVSDFEDLKANPKGKIKAVIIETTQDKRRGVLVSLLIRNGTLRVGSEVEVSGQKVRVRAMNDENKQEVKEALPGTPIEVLGFKNIPEIGQAIGGELKPIPITRKQPAVKKQSLSKKEIKEEDDIANKEEEEEEEKQTIKIVLKTDVVGTLEAITTNLSEEVEIIGKGIGEVTESDVLLAEATGATIYSFNTRTSNSAAKLAAIEQVNIKTYNVIYKLFEDLEKKILKILEPTIDEEELGQAKVIEEFEIGGERIAGCKVKSGEINKLHPVHLKRNDEIIASSKIKSLRREKEDVEKVKKGNNCGIKFKPKIDFKVNDVIMSYRKIES
jgi:translation initiation factor IF-2